MLLTFSMGFKSAAFAGNRAARNRCLAIQRCVRLALCPVCLSWYSVCFRVDMTGSNPSSSTLQYSFALKWLDTTFKSEARSNEKAPQTARPGLRGPLLGNRGRGSRMSYHCFGRRTGPSHCHTFSSAKKTCDHPMWWAKESLAHSSRCLCCFAVRACLWRAYPHRNVLIDLSFLSTVL